MRLEDVIKYIESWAPPESALEQDNPGLQVGDSSAAVKRIIVTLDVTDQVIDEAIALGANLILSHHPLIHKPLRRVSAEDGLGKQIARLLKHDIAVYAAHTNLDAARDGVSMVLAKILGVEKPRFLIPPDSRWLKKLAVFVPAQHLDRVREAMAQAGAGLIGNYSHCSFNLPGTGTFLGSDASSPSVGEKGKLESVAEIRLEMILPAWRLDAVTAAMKSVHPYEEVAYDVYPLDNADVNFGFGAIGELPEPVVLGVFMDRVRQKLSADVIGVVEGPARAISRLAVCGGSGGDLAEAAWKQGADALVTGEMKYHTLLQCKDRLTILIAGHYASERVILPVWAERLRNWLGDESVQVMETKTLTSPLKYQS